MTPNQFSALMERLDHRFDNFEEKFAGRLLRVELFTAAILGGFTLASALLGAGVIQLGG